MSQLFISIKKILGVALISFPTLLAAQAPTISYAPEITLEAKPIDIVNAGDGTNRLFIAEQAGNVKVWNGTTLGQFANFGPAGANLITLIGGEAGLLSIAFHPEYDGVNNRYFFIYYTDLNSDIAVSRYQTTAGNTNTADLSTGTLIITVPHPDEITHNGGKLNFGPDGYLYFAIGDGGGSGNDPLNSAQNGNVLLGKMVRINIDQTSATYGNYSVPPDNPYINDPAIDDRIYAMGLRNPFRWSFDRLNNDMWIGDVGQEAFEEINYRPAGSTAMVNYGWRCFEGFSSTPGVPDCTPANYAPPVYEYPNPNPGLSAVTGGYVYRGAQFPNFQGYYIATDVYSGTIYLLWPDGNGGVTPFVQTGSPIQYVVTFGEAEDGTLYAASQGTNIVYRVIATGGGPLPVTLTSFQGAVKEGYNKLLWSTSSELNTARFTVEYSKDGATFTRAGTVAASRKPSGSDYSFDHFINNPGEIFYRLLIEDDNGRTSYSSVVHLTGAQQNGIRIVPSLVSNGVINVQLNGKPVNLLKIINTNGTVVFRKEIRNTPGSMAITLPPLAKGMYVVELTGNQVNHTEKIMIR